jgi:hypothetical protein
VKISKKLENLVKFTLEKKRFPILLIPMLDVLDIDRGPKDAGAGWDTLIQ